MGSIIADICEALRTRLATIPGLRAHAEHPDTVNAPAAWPRFVSIEPNQDMSGAFTLVFEITLLIQPFEQGGARGQRAAWPYLAPSGVQSVIAAIEAAPSLGGIVDQVRVIRGRDLSSYEVNGVEYVGAIFDVEVWV